MAITPLENASFIPKSQEASQQKVAEMQKAVSEKMSFSEKFKQDIQRHSEQTIATKKSETPEYRYDARNKGSNPYLFSQKKKKKKQPPVTDSKQLPEEHQGFDIKI